MANLRDMVDGRTLEGAAVAGAPQPKKQVSPAAQHVAQHMQDPFGTTKDDLDDLNQKRMEYEMKKQEMNMKLLPSESVTQGIRQMHDMYPTDPNSGGGMGNPDPTMGYTDPNNPMGGAPGGASPGMTPPGGPQPSVTGLPPGQTTGMPPPNMMQQPGQTPPGKPAMGGMVPGAAPKVGVPGQAPGPAKSVVPPKMGIPQPGQGNAATVAGNPGGMPGMPGAKPSSGQPAGGWKPAGNMGPKPAPMPNPQQMMYNPGAPPPNGAGQLPGTKSPSGGGSKSKSKKPGESGSKSSSGGKVNIHVHADSMSPSPARTTQNSYTGSATLRSCNDYRKMEAHGDDCDCAVCKEKRQMDAYGTSEGVQKSWEVRQRASKRPQDTFERNRERSQNMVDRMPRQIRDVFDSHPSGGNRKDAPKTRSVDPGSDGRGDDNRPGAEERTRQAKQWNEAQSKDTSWFPGKKFNAAKLSMKKRKGLGKSQFVFPKQGPGSGSYPIPDANHARSALSLGKRHASPAQYQQIKQRVRSKFPDITVKSYGTSEGVSKAWESRGRGKKEPIVDLNDPRGFAKDPKREMFRRSPEGGGRAVIYPTVREAVRDGKLTLRGSDLDAVAPPGWEHSVKRMKKHKGITNPFALAWWMKDQGAHPHKKKLKAYGTPEGVAKAWDSRRQGIHERAHREPIGKGFDDYIKKNAESWRSIIEDNK